VQEGENASVRSLDDVAAKSQEIAGPGAAGIHGCGDAAAPTEIIGIDPQGRPAPINMGVKIDEAWRYQIS
jgi:hypothetical protein